MAKYKLVAIEAMQPIGFALIRSQLDSLVAIEAMQPIAMTPS